MTTPPFSIFGARFTERSATRQLMDDLGQAQRAEFELLNLGGGNPSRIAAVESVIHARLATLLNKRELEALLGGYDDPRGNHEFLAAVAGFFKRHLGWPVEIDNLFSTTGSQASFFMLFNLFSGPHAGGTRKRILLPQCPEYIGYSDLCIDRDALMAVPSRIEFGAPNRFRYTLDFDALNIDESIAALCISRPTNPTGNVISDQEYARLAALARQHAIPLIVDGAYGEPFPGITFVDRISRWDDNLIYCFSLSKLGLPGARTGLVVARPAVIDALASMNATMTLCGNPLGARLTAGLFESGEILTLSNEVIRPHYRHKVERALAICDEQFAGLDYFIHAAEGAIFLWVWFRDLPIPAQVLYQRLRKRGVFVIPGEGFCPGLRRPPQQLQECIRLSYAQDESVVWRGIAAIAEEVRACYLGRDGAT